MENAKKFFQHGWLMALVVVAGLAARLAVSLRGHTYDVDSYFIVAGILRHGGNVYLETKRYNYGPIWFYLIHLLDWLAGGRENILRCLIAGFLSLVDFGIFLVLLRRVGKLAASLFFLNPVSILITGYQSQFDNLVILMGLWAIHLFGDDFDQPVNRRKFYGLLVLGLSLMTKHLLFVFPLWLAVKQKGRWQKIIVLAVPVLCFLAGFLPYWADAHAAIIRNVFHYDSNPRDYFYDSFIPKVVQQFCGSESLWLLLLLGFAFFCRSKSAFESLLIYLGLIVAASPATANQYLAIPVALVAVYPSVLFGFFTVFSVLQIYADANDIDQRVRYDDLAIYALCFGMIWLLWKPQFLAMLRRMMDEVRLQFRGG